MAKDLSFRAALNRSGFFLTSKDLSITSSISTGLQSLRVKRCVCHSPFLAVQNKTVLEFKDFFHVSSSVDYYTPSEK
jgi:hypothetical protein